MKTCPNCGTQNPSDSAACCNCYASLDSKAGTTYSAPNPKPVTRRPEVPGSRQVRSSGGRSGFLAFLLVIIILGGAGYGGYWYFLRQTPEKAIKELTAVLNNNSAEVDDVAAYLSSGTKGLLESTGFLPFMKQIEAETKAKQSKSSGFSGFGGLDSLLSGGSENLNVKCESCDFADPEHATVTVTATVKLPGNPLAGSTGTPQEKSYSGIRVPMVREEGKWKIDGLKWIDDSLRALSNDKVKEVSGGIKLGEKFMGMLSGMSPTMPKITLTPVSQIVNKELRRRGIDPASVPPLKIPSFPMNPGW